MRMNIILILVTCLTSASASRNSRKKFAIEKRIKHASEAIASLIDILSDQYSIRFSVKSFGKSDTFDYLEKYILKISHTPINLMSCKKDALIKPGSSQILLISELSSLNLIFLTDFLESFSKKRTANSYQKEMILIYKNNETGKDYYELISKMTIKLGEKIFGKVYHF